MQVYPIPRKSRRQDDPLQGRHNPRGRRRWRRRHGLRGDVRPRAGLLRGRDRTERGIIPYVGNSSQADVFNDYYARRIASEMGSRDRR